MCVCVCVCVCVLRERVSQYTNKDRISIRPSRIDARTAHWGFSLIDRLPAFLQYTEPYPYIGVCFCGVGGGGGGA